MSSPNTAAEILAMPFGGQRRESTFLFLAPTTSDSYPTVPLTKSPAPKSPVRGPMQTANPQAQAAAAPGAEGIDIELLKTRRSSSLSSDGSSSKKRFLKLGPVHFGEGDGKGDWSEEVIAE